MILILFLLQQHYGAAGGGHYTAQCLCNDVNAKPSWQNNNSNNGTGATSDALSQSSLSNLSVGNNKKWYLFDDHRVRAISPLDLKTKNAYMLFYVRSDLQDLFSNKLNKMTMDGNMSDNIGKDIDSDESGLNSTTNLNGNSTNESGGRRKSKTAKNYNNPSFHVKKDEIEQQFEFLPTDVQQLVCKYLYLLRLLQFVCIDF